MWNQVIRLHQTDSEFRIRRFKHFSRHQAFTFQPLSVSVVLSAAEIQRSAIRLSSKWTVETKAPLYRLVQFGSRFSPRRQTSACASINWRSPQLTSHSFTPQPGVSAHDISSTCLRSCVFCSVSTADGSLKSHFLTADLGQMDKNTCT